MRHSVTELSVNKNVTIHPEDMPEALNKQFKSVFVPPDKNPLPEMLKYNIEKHIQEQEADISGSFYYSFTTLPEIDVQPATIPKTVSDAFTAELYFSFTTLPEIDMNNGKRF